MTASPMVFTIAPGLGRHDILQNVKVLSDEIVGDEIADPLIKRGGALEIGEEEREARDLEPLIDIEDVGAIDVAKRLVGQEALCGEERLALAEQVMEPIAGDPQRRNDAAVRAVLERQAQRPRPQLDRSGRRLELVEHHGEGLTLTRRFSLDVEKLRPVRHRIEDDDEVIGQLHREHRFFAGGEFDRIDGELGDAVTAATPANRRRSSRRSGDNTRPPEAYRDRGRRCGGHGGSP